MVHYTESKTYLQPLTYKHNTQVHKFMNTTSLSLSLLLHSRGATTVFQSSAFTSDIFAATNPRWWGWASIVRSQGYRPESMLEWRYKVRNTNGTTMPKSTSNQSSYSIKCWKWINCNWLTKLAQWTKWRKTATISYIRKRPDPLRSSICIRTQLWSRKTDCQLRYWYTEPQHLRGWDPVVPQRCRNELIKYQKNNTLTMKNMKKRNLYTLV